MRNVMPLFSESRRRVSIFRAVGGLGNQLFILTAALAYSHNSGRKVVIDQRQAAKGSAKGGPHAQDSRLSSLALNGMQIQDKRVVRAIGHVLDLTSSVAQRTVSAVTKHYYNTTPWSYSSPELGFDEEIFRLRRAYWKGYFQSYKYLQYLRDNKVPFNLSIFRPSSTYIGLHEELLSLPHRVIHIRRGDYTKHSKQLGLLDSQFYERAIELLEFTMPGLANIVFSDDPQILSRPGFRDLAKAKGLRIINTAALDPAEALFLMTIAKQHVIANSSFGWFGASLANSSQVVVPRPWFAKVDQPGDLFPQHWIQLNASWENS